MDGTMWYLGLYTPITDPAELEKDFGAFLVGAGFQIVSGLLKPFQPQGYSSYKKLSVDAFLLSESHSSMHTFPEEDRTYVDLLSCVKAQLERFHELIRPWEGTVVFVVEQPSIIMPPKGMKK